MKRIILGTRNQKKRLELEALLMPRGIQVATLDEFPDAIEIIEDGDSFAAKIVPKLKSAA